MTLQRHALAPMAMAAVVIGGANFLALFVVTLASSSAPSPLHEASVFMTHPAAILGGFYLLITYIFGPSLYGDLDPDEAVEELIKESGDIIAGGEYGMRQPFSGMIVAWLHPAGLWIKPWFMRPFGIPNEAIHSVRVDRDLYGSSLNVSYDVGRGGSEFGLQCRPDDPLAIALLQMANGQAANALTSAST